MSSFHERTSSLREHTPSLRTYEQSLREDIQALNKHCAEIRQIDFLQDYANEHPQRYKRAADCTKNIDILEKICKNWLLFCAARQTSNHVFDNLEAALTHKCETNNIIIHFKSLGLWSRSNGYWQKQLATILRFIDADHGMITKIVFVEFPHKLTFRCVNSKFAPGLTELAKYHFDTGAYHAGDQITVELEVNDESESLSKCTELYNYLISCREFDHADAIAPMITAKCLGTSQLAHGYQEHICAEIIKESYEHTIPSYEVISFEKDWLTQKDIEFMADAWISGTEPGQSEFTNEYYQSYKNAIKPSLNMDAFNKMISAHGYNTITYNGKQRWCQISTTKNSVFFSFNGKK